MSRRLRKHANILQTLNKCHPSVRKLIINNADKDLTNCLGECAHNILKGNVNLSQSEKTRLKKYKTHLRKVANKKSSIKNRKKILQTGGFLPLLLGPIIKSVLLPLAGSLLGGK